MLRIPRYLFEKKLDQMKKIILLVTLIIPLILTAQEADTTFGYENTDNIGGPKSVGRQLEVDNNKYTFEYRYPIKYFKGWYDLKDRINKKTGIQYAINYTALYMRSSSVISPENNQNTGGGILDINAGWNLVGRKSGKNKGTLFIKFNSRHAYGNLTAPMFHGLNESGYYGLPGTAFHDYTFRIIELNWVQNLWDNRIGFVIGKIDNTNYFNFHGLMVPWQHFQGWGSGLSGTMNWGNQGLGAVVSVRPLEKFYVMAGVIDVYGDRFEKGEFLDFGRHWQDGDLQTNIEIGFVPSYQERYFKKISLTYWHTPQYVAYGSENTIKMGQGMAFTSHWFFKERFAPFFRFGISNGVGENAFYKKDVQIGHGLRFRHFDILGTSVSWNEPNIEGAESQYTAEIFYRLNLSAHLEFTFDYQLILNPALNPDKSGLSYFGIRGRITL